MPSIIKFVNGQTMRELADAHSVGQRLCEALAAAGAMDLPVSDFCARFPYVALVRYRNFKRNTVAELAELLMSLDRPYPEINVWLRSIPEPVLEKTCWQVFLDCRSKPTG